MLEILNEIKELFRTDVNCSNLDKMDMIDETVRNIDTNGLNNESMSAYNKCQDFLFDYYANKDYEETLKKFGE